jgi:nitrile hydratase
MRGYHDLGGVPSDPFETAEHDLTQWEREVDAIRMLLADDRRRLLNGEEVRRVITSMGADKYDDLSYYERWLHGFRVVLIEKGTITEAELAGAIAELDDDFGHPTANHACGHDHHDHDDHDHGDHSHDGHGHEHAHAADHEDHDPFSPESRRLAEALKNLLIAKEIVTFADIRATIDFYDSRGAHLGARAVARAWLDPDFKARLLERPNETLAEIGIDLLETRLCVVENTPDVHNMIVCTLCSCYPRTLLGRPPAWYKSKAYRARAVDRPRELLTKLGVNLPTEVTLRVHDSTADLRYMVLPVRPADTENLDAEALAALVTRDTMIGTAIVSTSNGDFRQ